MYFFPIVIAQKKNQGILDHLRRELEMNVKFTSITNLDYFIKNELKYYEYITHIIVDMGCTDEQGEAFLTEIEALRLSTDVPIIIYAEDKFPGDEVLSTIARKGLANIIGETPKKLKRDSKRRMKDDIGKLLLNQILNILSDSVKNDRRDLILLILRQRWIKENRQHHLIRI